MGRLTLDPTGEGVMIPHKVPVPATWEDNMDHQIVSVTRLATGGYPYFQPAVYTATPRLDGVVTWRRTALVCVSTRSEAKAKREAEDYAADNGLSIDFNIRHGVKVKRPRYAAVAVRAASEGGVE